MNKVIVLLSTYNGGKYLEKQIISLLNQTHKNIRIIVRDDGSVDNTLNIIKKYKLEVLENMENFGVKKSFQLLLEYAVQNTDNEYFMFCDQDDLWKNTKIEKTFKKIKELEKKYFNQPLLVHTDLEVVDEDLNTINKSLMSYQNIDVRKNNLNNLLIQNNVTGCTIMINRKLAIKTLPMPREIIIHDWWIALIGSKFGKIGYVDESTILYRQHTKNCVGAKKFSLSFVLKSIFVSSSLSVNILQAKAFLVKFENELNNKDIEMLNEFIKIEKKSFFEKRIILLKYKFLKHGLVRNIGLFLKI